MGLAAGGRMKQKIYPDPHGIDTWDQDNTSRVFVHIVNSDLWRQITGEEPPRTPITAKDYASHGYPWFDIYDEAAPTVAPTTTLADVKSITEVDADRSAVPLQDDDSIAVGPIKKLWIALAGDAVRGEARGDRAESRRLGSRAIIRGRRVRWPPIPPGCGARGAWRVA